MTVKDFGQESGEALMRAFNGDQLAEPAQTTPVEAVYVPPRVALVLINEALNR